MTRHALSVVMPPGTRTRDLLVLAALVAALLVGPAAARVLVDPSPDDEGSADAAADADDGGVAATTVLPFGYTQCTAVVALVVVPLERLAPHVPPGFIVGANPAPGLATVGIETDRCLFMDGLNGRVANQPYGSLWVGAQPPAALHMGDGFQYFLGWDAVIPDADRRALMTTGGIPARDGSVTAPLTWTVGARGVHVDMTMEGHGTFTMVAAGANPVATVTGGDIIQYTPGSDGTLSRWAFTWQTKTINLPNSVAGTVTIPEQSWLRAVVGAEVAPARFLVATWDYVDGSVEFPLSLP